MDKLELFTKSIIQLIQTHPGIEGFMVPQQSVQLMNFLHCHPEIQMIAETGFNVGMSSATMLSVRPEIKIWSFDLCSHPYVPKQKQIIDDLFPSRHTLIIGDSTQTLPNFNVAAKEDIFDFVFVDGGHVAPVPEKDMRNLLKHLKPGGYMCIDDYNHIHGSQGVMQAVDKLIDEKLLEKLDVHSEMDRSWVYCRKI
jgi:predicted O-methyltransferase YrrM